MTNVTFNSEFCFVCYEFMGDLRNELSILTGYADKHLFEIIEDIFSLKFDGEIINDAGVCQNCYFKLIEYTEHLAEATKIQDELQKTFETVQNENLAAKMEQNELKQESIEEEAIVYDDDSQIPTEDIYVTEEQENHDPIIEYDWGEDQKSTTDHVKYKIDRSDDFMTVIKTEDDLKLYQCDICFRAFRERSKLKSHREIHTDQRNVICPTCGKAFKTQACLRSHKRVHNPTYLYCDICGKSYTQKPELAKHIKFVHYQIREFRCDFCGAGFGSRGHLNAHKITHLDQPVKANACDVCSLSFHTRAKLERHMKSHTGERNYECGLCQKRFLYSYNVTAHIKHVHEKQKRKETAADCHICGKKFSKLWKLTEHIDTFHRQIEAEQSIQDETQFIIEETLEQLA